jgi:hypothetical protein
VVKFDHHRFWVAGEMADAWTAEGWRDHFNERGAILEMIAGTVHAYASTCDATNAATNRTTSRPLKKSLASGIVM